MFDDWLMVRMNSHGWDIEADRLEILWGPSYGDRYDYLVFQNGQIKSFFAPLPNMDEIGLSMVDKRGELASFDVEEAFRNIGISVNRPVRRRAPESEHIMY